MNEWFAKVEKICQDVCQTVGCYLYDLNLTGTGNGRALQVFIDRDGGAGIEDCSNVSKGLNEILDRDESLIPGGAYNLEVSTPGIDRSLRKAWHFEKVIGQKIWVKTQVPFGELGVAEPSLEKAKNVEAVLKDFKNETLTMENKKGDFNLPLSAVEKSKVVFDIKKKLKP